MSKHISFIGPKGAYGWPRWRWALHLWVNGLLQIVDGLVRVVTFGYFGTDFTFTHIAKVARDGCRRQIQKQEQS